MAATYIMCPLFVIVRFRPAHPRLVNGVVSTPYLLSAMHDVLGFALICLILGVLGRIFVRVFVKSPLDNVPGPPALSFAKGSRLCFDIRCSWSSDNVRQVTSLSYTTAMVGVSSKIYVRNMAESSRSMEHTVCVRISS